MIKLTKENGLDVIHRLSTDDVDEALAVLDGADPVKDVVVDEDKVYMLLDGQWYEQSDGGGGTPSAITVNANGTYTNENGYSPVTVDVANTGSHSTYIKTFNSLSDISISAEEAVILDGTTGRLENGNLVTGFYFVNDGGDTYVFSGIGVWVLFHFMFGIITITTTGGLYSTNLYAWTMGSSNPPETYTMTGSVTFTFYVTAAQKAALDAL